MSYEAMLAVLSSDLEKIQPLTETPATVKHTPDELTNAEEEIKDKKEEVNEKDEQYREEHKEEDTDASDSLDSDISSDDSDISTDTTETGGEDKTDSDLSNFGVDSDSEELSKDMDDKDKSDSEIDNKLAEMSIYKRMMFHFLKDEYSTPSGSDSNLCPNCSGTADAADAAIIDNEVVKTERTEPFGSIDDNGGGGDYGGDYGGGDDYGGGFDMGDGAFQFHFNPATEDLDEGIEFAKTRLKEIAYLTEATLRFSEKVFHTVSKITVTVLHKLDHAIERNFIKLRHISKFYEYKFKPIIGLVKDEALSEVKIEAFSAEDWVFIQSNCNEIYKLLSNVSKQLTCPQNSFNNVINDYKKAFSKLHVSITDNTPSKCLKELYDKRTGASVLELGYNPRDLLKLIRHLGQLGDICDKEALSSIKKSIENYGNVLSNESRNLKTDAKDDNGKDIAKRKELLEFNTKKYDFIMNVVEVYCDLTTSLVDDIYNVCYRYEKAVIPKYLRSDL